MKTDVHISGMDYKTVEFLCFNQSLSHYQHVLITCSLFEMYSINYQLLYKQINQ